MIFTEHEIVRKEKANGGKGHIIIEHLLTKKRIKKNNAVCSLMLLQSQIVLQAIMNITVTAKLIISLKGSGLYSDNGNIIEVKAGDVVFCPDGEGHGIENTSSSENLEFTALIINTVK